MSINAVAVYAGKKIIVAPGADVSFGKNRVADVGPAVEDFDALNLGGFKRTIVALGFKSQSLLPLRCVTTASTDYIFDKLDIWIQSGKFRGTLSGK